MRKTKQQEIDELKCCNNDLRDELGSTRDDRDALCERLDALNEYGTSLPFRKVQVIVYDSENRQIVDSEVLLNLSDKLTFVVDEGVVTTGIRRGSK